MDRETPEPTLEPLLEQRELLSLPARLEAILYLKGRALTLGNWLRSPPLVATRRSWG